MNCGPLGSSVHGISQARILEQGAISEDLEGIFLTRDQTHIFCIAGRFFTTEPPGKLNIIKHNSATRLQALCGIRGNTKMIAPEVFMSS